MEKWLAENEEKAFTPVKIRKGTEDEHITSSTDCRESSVSSVDSFAAEEGMKRAA